MDKDIHFSIVEKYGKKFLHVVYSSDSWQFILRFFLVYGMCGKAIRIILRGLQKDVLKRMNKAVLCNKNGGRRDENERGSV